VTCHIASDTSPTLPAEKPFAKLRDEVVLAHRVSVYWISADASADKDEGFVWRSFVGDLCPPLLARNWVASVLVMRSPSRVPG
jgi:hypothetical protein